MPNAGLSVSRQCMLLGIARSSFYYQPRLTSANEVDLLNRLDQIFTAHPVYGSRQLQVALLRERISVGRRRDRVAGFRVLPLLPGVGPGLAQRVLAAMADQPHPLRALTNIPAQSRTGDSWGDFVQTLQTICAGKAGGECQASCRLSYVMIPPIDEAAALAA